MTRKGMAGDGGTNNYGRNRHTHGRVRKSARRKGRHLETKNHHRDERTSQPEPPPHHQGEDLGLRKKFISRHSNQIMELCKNYTTSDAKSDSAKALEARSRRVQMRPSKALGAIIATAYDWLWSTLEASILVIALVGGSGLLVWLCAGVATQVV